MLVHGSELPSVPLSLDGLSMTLPSFPSQGQLTEQCWLQACGEDCLAGRHLCGYRWCPGSGAGAGSSGQHPKGPDVAGSVRMGLLGVSRSWPGR